MNEDKPAVSILRELEFEIIREGWNTYVLADQTRVKGRIILVKLLADKTPLFTASPTGPVQQAAVKPLFTYVFSTSAPLNMKGEPGYLVFTSTNPENGEEWELFVFGITENGKLFLNTFGDENEEIIRKEYVCHLGNAELNTSSL